MNWIAILETVLRTLPSFVPMMLRKLADELEAHPELLTKLIEEARKK